MRPHTFSAWTNTKARAWRSEIGPGKLGSATAMTPIERGLLPHSVRCTVPRTHRFGGLLTHKFDDRRIEKVTS